jgi:hypothetical protein
MLAWRYVVRQAGRCGVVRNFASKRSALHSVDISAFPRIDLKVDAARPIFAFSQPD